MKPTQKKVLFVEDHAEDRIPIAKFLRTKGWVVTEVANPQQAIECIDECDAASSPCNAIILDLAMPDDNPKAGEEVLAHMRVCDEEKKRISGLPNLSPIPVIIASAWGYNGLARRAKEVYPAAVWHTFSKPYGVQDLLTKLNETLRRPTKIS